MLLGFSLESLLEHPELQRVCISRAVGSSLAVSPTLIMRRGVLPVLCLFTWLSCWVLPSRNQSLVQRPAGALTERSVEDLRWSLLRMAAALDRGQAYNPTSGDYYAERMAVARELLDELLQRPSKNFTMEHLDGEWELVFSTVKHGIFRSSPFFLAVQEAFGDQEKSELFFKLHELQVGSKMVRTRARYHCYDYL